jgi:hypothetical protein
VSKALRYARCRGAETSTWVGLTALATLLAVILRPEEAEAIIKAGVAVMGCLKVGLPDVLGGQTPAPLPEADGSFWMPDRQR